MTTTTFPVRVADRATGREFTLKIDAANRAEAIKKAQGGDWLVAGIDAQYATMAAEADAKAAAELESNDLAGIRHELVALNQRLANAQIVAHPKTVVALGMFYGFVFCGIIAGIVALGIAVITGLANR